jgi:hypothetical protein
MRRDINAVKRGERFIRYNPKQQRWCVYTLMSVPQIRGSFSTVIGAVFNALKE